MTLTSDDAPSFTEMPSGRGPINWTVNSPIEGIGIAHLPSSPETTEPISVPASSTIVIVTSELLHALPELFREILLRYLERKQ